MVCGFIVGRGDVVSQCGCCVLQTDVLMVVYLFVSSESSGDEGDECIC